MIFLFCVKTQMEMLFCSTLVGLPMLIPPMLFTGELFQAWTSCSQVHFKIGMNYSFHTWLLLLSSQNWKRISNILSFSCSICMCMECWCLKQWQHLLAKFLCCHSLPFLELPLQPWYISLTSFPIVPWCLSGLGTININYSFMSS